jgi:predicted ATPase/DNA-binding CsgD family transcriptional regulator
VGEDASGTALAGLHGFAPALTSFVGRADEVDKTVGLLDEYRLVTVTGPGGVGKSRLAAEVARRVAGRFADGVWLVELAAVQDPAFVPAAVAAVLGVQQGPGVSVTESLAGVLGRQQMLLVLDNCEHLLAPAAQLCGALLVAADDLRVLATSRELIGVAGEARFRLPALSVPGLDAPAETDGSEAVALFADRARQADSDFVLTRENGPLVGQLVARLDGMPLAIELAAARVEALGVVQLLDRLDHRFGLLVGADRTAVARQRSLEATVDWSYQLLSDLEQLVFRRLAIFPGPFTLDAAEAVAGSGAEPVVLHLVDCSLISPPRTGPDGRGRYVMLETLRAYGAARLAVGEYSAVAAALARHALQVAEEAAAGMQSSAGELPAARWLDAEDAAIHQALAWALEHDRPTAVRLAVALAPWWALRGRWAAGYELLRRATERAAHGGTQWCAGQFWLGLLAHYTSDYTVALGHFTAILQAQSNVAPSPELVDGLDGKSGVLRNLGRLLEAGKDARRALELARQIGYPGGEARALTQLSLTSYYDGDIENALEWAWQTQRINPAAIPGWAARRCGIALANVLAATSQTAAAQRIYADIVVQARDAGDLGDQADLAYLAQTLARQGGQMADAGAHLRESLRLAAQTGNRLRMIDCLDDCGHLCAATGRWAEAITLWTVFTAQNAEIGIPDLPLETHQRQEPMREARHALGPGQARAAEERGAAMTLATAAEFAAMLTTPGPRPTQELTALGELSTREQELVILVAQGCTDAQIAGQLYISVSTVRSHLDRIRDKTSCRRRADLTRLALQHGLV